jgi:protein-S-isoprenylcysteine O-methyltransferase Ste14
MTIDPSPRRERTSNDTASGTFRSAHRWFGAIAFGAGLGSMIAFAVWEATLPSREFGQEPAAPGAFAVDFALILAFGLVHSALAREPIRRRVMYRLPPELQRSLYTLIAAAQIALLVACWQPLPGIVWELDAIALRGCVWGAHALGWLTALASFRAVGAAHLFGLAQARASAEGHRYVEPELSATGPYRWLRHPLYAGTLVAMWAMPAMTTGRFLLAAGLSLYLAIGAKLEERSLSIRGRVSAPG